MRTSILMALLFVMGVGAQTPPQAQTSPQSQPAEVASVQMQPVVPDSMVNPMAKISASDTAKIPVLDFKNADVRDVLRGIGMQYGINIYVEPDALGQVSLYLTNVTVKHAIDFVVKRSGNAYTVDNGIVKVYRPHAPPAPEPPKPLVVFNLKDGMLNIDFKKVPIQEVARMFGDSAKINVMIDGVAEGDITARLVNIAPEKAVRAIFETNGYSVSVSDGIHYISKAAVGAAAGGGSRHLSFVVKHGLVTLEVDNAQLDQTIRSIVNGSGMNMVMYDRIEGSVTANSGTCPLMTPCATCCRTRNLPCGRNARFTSSARGR